MEREIEQLTALPAVEGAFLCDNRGDVIVSSDPAVLATVTMNTIGREIGRAFVALQAAGFPATRLDLTYDTWRLFAHDIGDAVLFVVAQPSVDIAMVRMTADVVTATWQKDPAARKRLQKHRSERAQLVNRTALDPGSWLSWNIIAQRGG
jgi:predicted regulator of Ras-like GTPase activity (Roadblock/LC7/MglB family)